MLKSAQSFYSFTRTIEILAFICVFALIALQAVPLFVSNNDVILHYATSQQALSQRIAKDALILQYSPTNDHTMAISELQNMLPTWESNQNNLRNSNLPAAPQALFLDSNSNYVSIDTAVHAILVHPQNTSVETQIIHMQEHAYFIAVSQIANEMQQEEYHSRDMLFWIEEAVCVILVIVKVIFVAVIEISAKRYAREHQEK